MNETMKLALRLMIFALAAALLLAVVNALTADKITQNTNEKINASRQAVIGDYTFTEAETDLTGYPLIKGIFAASSGDAPVGYVYELGSRGYGGEISLSVGIGTDGVVTGISVSNHSETKGLGTSAADTFLNAFVGMQAGQDDATGVDAMSGATVSSTAIRKAVDEALRHFSENQDTMGVNAQ